MKDIRDMILCDPDRRIIDKLKHLMDIKPKKPDDKAVQSDFEELIGSLGTEISYQRVCEYNYHEANILEAAYQVFQAAKDKKSYQGIDSYEYILGKKISKVLIEKPKSGRVLHDVILSNGGFAKCFYTKILFLFEEHLQNNIQDN